MTIADIIDSTRRLWPHLTRRDRYQLAGLAIIMLGASVVEVFSIGSVVPFLAVLASPEQAMQNQYLKAFANLIGINSSLAFAGAVTASFCLIMVLSGIGRYALLYAQTHITYTIGLKISVQMFERTLYQPYLIHISRNSSEVVAGIAQKANEIIVSFLYPMATMVGSLIILAVSLGTFAVTEPFLTAGIILAFLAFYVSVSFIVRERLASSSVAMSRQYSQVIRLIQESLGGIRDILLDGTQPAFVRNYIDAETGLRRSRATVQVLSGTPRFIVESLGTISIAVLAFFVATGSTGMMGAITLLGVTALASQKLIPVVHQLYSAWAGLSGGNNSVKDALSLLEQSIDERQQSSDMAIGFCSDIRFEDVTFRYGPGQRKVLAGVSLRISKGEWIGIVGATGSGKSTFLDLLMALVAPSEGSIYVDGCLIEDRSVSSWQKQIAHVPQTVYLSDASIAENIAFGTRRSDIDMERVVAAASTAQLSGVIAKLPDGYETLVGERGVRLSGGQRQRLGLARALYKNAALIVLDEATSALDMETEEAVMKSLSGLPGSVTLVIVAHRHSTLRNCDRVLLISDSQLSEAGGIIN